MPASLDSLERQSAAELRCAWCGAPLGQDRKRLHGRSVCVACGTATTDPWPDDATLDRAYAGWYRPEGGRFAGLGDTLIRRTRGALAARIDALAPPGEVLDVGAGDGLLLDALARRGRAATGLERSSPRPDVQARELHEVEDSYAAVVMWHSLEHLRNPGEALSDVARVLVPGGVAFIALPNSDSIQARVFGDRWFALDLPRHLVHVGARAVTERLAQVGLTVTRVSHVRGGQVVFGWVHGLTGLVLQGADLYDAIRRPEARSRPMPAGMRAATLGVAAMLLPVAALCATGEILARRGGTVYLEARRG